MSLIAWVRARSATHQTRVLDALRSAPGRYWYVPELCQQTRLRSAAVYIALGRLEEAGKVVTRWEHEPLPKQTRPPRRMYRVHPDHAREAA